MAGRKQQSIWTVKDGTVTKYDGQTSAAKLLGIKQGSISYALRSGRETKGYRFFYNEPTEEEIADANKPKPTKKTRNTQACIEKIQNLVFEVDCTNREVFFLERSREKRVAQLEAFVRKRLEPRWRNIEKNKAVLEKRFLSELLKSLK